MRRITVLLILVVLFALPAEVALAHPADMYMQVHTVDLSPEGVTVVWEVNPGPLLAGAVWGDADQDDDETVTPAEAKAWATAQLKQFTATLDETTPLPWEIESIDWPTNFVSFQLGDEIIGIHLAANWSADDSGDRRLTLKNHYEEAISISWYYLNSTDDLMFNTPQQQGGTLTVEWAAISAEDAPEGWRDYWDSGMPQLGASASGEVAPSQPQDNRPSAILTRLAREEDSSPIFYLAALGVALLLGTVHALTPGHGKALVAAYLVGARGTIRHAIALGGIVTLTHTGSVLTIGFVTLIASMFFVPTAIFPLLEVASGLLIIGMGLGMVHRRWRGFQAVRRARKTAVNPLPPPPSTAAAPERTRIAINQPLATRVYDDVLPEDNLTLNTINWRSLVTLGISGGLVPCPDAIALLLVTVTINRILLGLSMILSFSVGMALVLVAIGILIVRSRRSFENVGLFSRYAPALSVISAVVVLGLGLVLTYNALSGSGLISANPESYVAAADAEAVAPAFAMEQASMLYLAPDENERQQLMIMPLGSEIPLALTDDSSGIWDFALSPDGSTIVYSLLQESGDGELWALNNDGSNRHRILTCPQSICSGAVWSPDSTRLVYERVDDPTFGNLTLWSADIASGETSPIFQDSTVPGFAPRWSPDGQWLSYVSPSSGQGLQLYNLSEGKNLSLESQAGAAVIWSPTSDSVLLLDMRVVDDRYLSHLLRYDIASKELVDLNPGGKIEDRAMSWSPDGEWLAVVRYQPAEEDYRGDQLWLMRPDGSEAQLLTDEPNYIHGTPVWSPDSRYLLYHRYALAERWAKPTILMLDITTAETRTLIKPGYWPQWLP